MNSEGGQINVQNQSLLDLLDERESKTPEAEAEVTTLYVESPVSTREDEDKYKYVSEQVEEFDEEQDEALSRSRESAREARKLQTNVGVNSPDDDITSDTSAYPDAVVNLKFDAHGTLIGAEQEKRITSAASSSLSSRANTQFAIRNNTLRASREDSAKSTISGEGSVRSKGASHTRSAGGMKPLSREEQRDLEELEQEEKYQRAEQKKIQELQNRTSGINIPKLDLVDSEDENHKGDSGDLALHEGTPRNHEDSPRVVDSLEEPESSNPPAHAQWSDPPQDPTRSAAHAQRRNSSASRRESSAQSEKHKENSSHGNESRPRDAQEKNSRQNSSQSAEVRENSARKTRDSAPEPWEREGQDSGWHDPWAQPHGDQDPRLQQLFGHQVAQYPYVGPQGPVPKAQMSDNQGFHGFNLNSSFNSHRGQFPTQYGPNRGHIRQQTYNSEGSYFDSAGGQVQGFPPGYVDQAPVLTPRRSYHENASLNNSHNSQHGGFASHQIQEFYATRTPYEYSYNYTPEQGSYRPPESFSATSNQSSTLPPSSPKHGSDFIRLNKKHLKSPPKKSYKHMFGRKKELIENEQPFIPQGRRGKQGLSPVDKGKKSPLKPLPNQNSIVESQQPMTAEEFWKRRAAKLENRNGGGAVRANDTFSRNYTNESKVPPVKNADQGQSIPEPMNNQLSRSPRAQPMTQTLYTEDGQRVSVDINLQLVSPPAVGGPTRPEYPSYQQRPPPGGYGGPPPGGYGGPSPGGYRGPLPQGGPPRHLQQTVGYGGPSNQFSYRAPVQHPPPVHTSRTAWGQSPGTFYDPHVPQYDAPPPQTDPSGGYSRSPIQSPYNVLPPIGSAESRERLLEEERHYQELLMGDRESARGTTQKEPGNTSTTPGRDEEGQPGSYMNQFIKTKNRKFDYKEYTLRDYRKMAREVRLGGLGPDVDSEDVKEKKEKKSRQQEYAKQIKEKNRAALENARRKAPPPRPNLDPEKELQSERRKLAQEYARKVPKPKVFTGSLYRTSPERSTQNPGGSPASNTDSELDREMEELQRLAERHAREKQQTEAIRQNMDHTLAAR